MGRHTQQRDHKLAHTTLLTLSILSIGSPFGLIMGISPPKVETEAEEEPSIDSLDTSWLALPQGPPNVNLYIPKSTVAKSTKATKKTKATKPTKPTKPTKVTQRVTTQKKTQASPSKTTTKPTTKPPTSHPVPTVTTRTSKPSVVQRQITKSTTPRPTPTTTPKPTTTVVKTISPPQSTVGERVVAVAKTYVGDNLPYKMGGDSLTTGIDCSHFVWRVLKEAGLNVSYRDSSSLAAWTQRVANPQVGDLVLYTGHVGIYAGNGMMVHHGRSGGAFFVKVYTNNFIGYGRLPV